MIEVRLGEGERLADVARIGLAQRVVPAFHVTGLPAGFGYTLMRRERQDVARGVPEIAETATPSIGRRNALPQLPTGLRTAVANREGDNLPGAPTQGSPQPGDVPLKALQHNPTLSVTSSSDFHTVAAQWVSPVRSIRGMRLALIEECHAQNFYICMIY